MYSFLIWNQSVVPCQVQPVAFWPAYRFLRRQVRWFDIPIFWEFSTVYCDLYSQSFGIVNKTAVDVFLEFSCFFDDPMDGGNLTSGSSAFSKSSLNIWKFTVHVLLKPGLENFEHYFDSLWDECNWHCLSLGLEWKLTFSSPVATAEFSKFAGILIAALSQASSFRIWNSSAGIPSSPLTLFIVVLS